MKLKRILGGLILSTIMGVGVAAGVGMNSKSAQSVEAYDSRLHIVGSETFGGWTPAGAVQLQDVGGDNVGGKLGQTISATSEFKIAYIDGGNIQWGWDNYGSGAMDNREYKFAEGAGDNIKIKYDGKYNIYLTNSYKIYMNRDITITFNPNEGTVSPTSKVVNQSYNGNASNVYGDLPTPTRSGYRFNGWYTSSSGGDLVTSSSSTYNLEEDQILYARWTAQHVVTKYAVYNGTVDTQNPLGSDTVDSGSTYNVPDSIYKPGYTFNGWYTDTTCTTKYTTRAITSDTPLYAKYLSGTWKSEVQVDLRSSGFDLDDHNYAVYFYDDVTYPQDVYGWSSYVRVNAGNCRVIIPYTLQFAPVGMVFMVYDKNYSQSSWESDPWNTSVVFHSENLTYVRSPFLAVSDQNQYGTWTVAVEPDSYPTVQGRKTPEGQWGTDIYYEIRSSRPTAEGHYQYFSQYIELTAGSEFKIVHVGSYYGFSEIVSIHECLEGVFSVGSENDNIACSANGTYKFYFDSKTHAIEITTEALERIDEWATILVGTDDEPRVCENTMHYWGSAKDAYESYYFPAEARALCLAEEHVGPNDPVTTLLAKAIQRYDHVLRVYGVYDEDTNPDGYVDYIGRVAAGKLSLSHPISILGGFDNNNTTPIIVIVIVSLVAVTTIGGYFYLRHKKEQ